MDNVPVDRDWWKEAVVYQIYPRSFNDSDGDGIGDLQGVTERVEYLDDLGVDVVWLCPVYESPMADNGYDISDYRSIHPEFGTIDDWEALLAELHAHDIRLVMDLVVNHTSDEHEWFQRSRQREDGYEDYYYWRDGDVDENGNPVPPNNWGSFMGGSAWSYDEAREQWYLHIFDEKQPDLNWRNPEVREEVADIVNWWLDKGIDGFRIDAIHFISKPEGLPDATGDREPTGVELYGHGPRIHEYLRELHDRTFANYDAMTVAEMADTTVEMADDYLGESGDGLNMIFHFEHMYMDNGPRGRWDPEGWGDWELTELKGIMRRWQGDLTDDGWNAQYLGNHDQPRIVSRFGDDDEFHRESATLLATFLLTSRGTPFIYQGEEIGMTNAEWLTIDDLDDPMTIGAIEDLIDAGEIDGYDEVREFVEYMTRDNARTPIQWDDSENAGFTDGEPWLQLNENYPAINVEKARADEGSIWQYYRRLIDLRDAEDALVYGDFELLAPDHDQLFAYTRTGTAETFLIVLNWSDEPATFEGASVDAAPGAIVTSNYEDSPADPAGATLRPYEAVVYRL